MRYYLSVYKQFLSTCFSKDLSFRTSFFLIIFMELATYIATLYSVQFIFDHITLMGKWNKEQLSFFIAFVLTVNNLHMTFISESFWEFSFSLRTGDLDFILLRPPHSIFTVFFRFIRPSTIVLTPLYFSILYYFAFALNLSVFWLIALPFLVILSFFLTALIDITISTSMFWLTEGMGVNFFRLQLQQMSRWPHYIYSNLTRKFFTFIIPVLLIGSAPVGLIFDAKNYIWIFLGLIVSIFIYIPILFKVWKIGLNQYHSASS